MFHWSGGPAYSGSPGGTCLDRCRTIGNGCGCVAVVGKYFAEPFLGQFCLCQANVMVLIRWFWPRAGKDRHQRGRRACNRSQAIAEQRPLRDQGVDERGQGLLL